MALVRDALRFLGVLVMYPVARRPVRPLADEEHPLDFGLQRRRLLNLERLVEAA